jgi:DNA-binding CsgD family transcriptional regulator
VSTTTAFGTGKLLERADDLVVLEDALEDVRTTGRGELVLVTGEAGIGKTALVQVFCAGLEDVQVLWGVCEPLHTPRPLGPLVDIAAESQGELAALLRQKAGPSDVLSGLMNELRSRAATVVVLEDLHWADEATLDLIRLLGRRIANVPALVVATYRVDALERHHPLRVVLGELPQAAVTRLSLAPLTAAGVAELASFYCCEPAELHRRTAGNPFYVTEVLAAGCAAVPDSVRDAVLSRAARIGERARDLLDAVAIAPPRAELWLLEALAGGDLGDLEACLASGMLVARSDAVAFRHEIARVAVEEALPPDRALALHRTALATLAAAKSRHVDPARLAHHSEAAADGAAVLRYATAAGETASLLGAHREAAAQFARALRFADRLPSEERVELLERHSYECYLTASLDEAIGSRRRALAEHRERGDRLREGDTHRWLSRLNWYAGDRATAEHEGSTAVEVLERLPPTEALAMAYSNMAQLRMLATDLEGARTWGGYAIELARRLGEDRALLHALGNVGSAELRAGLGEGAERLEQSLALALELGFDDDAGRAYTNLATGYVQLHDHAAAERYLEEGIAYCCDRDLDAFFLYMSGWQTRLRLEQGRWRDADAAVSALLDEPSIPPPSKVAPLIVRGLLRARRGNPNLWEPLDEALELARRLDEVQRLAPVAAARAEAHWLAGGPELVAAETDKALARATELGDAWAIGELSVWRRRAGIDEPVPAVCAEPFRLELLGEPEAAAELWFELGCPYEAALARLASLDEKTARRSLSDLRLLGADATARRAARVLRERGVRDVSYGPRSSTRNNPAGLTARELEVLELLADGLRNSHIADRLVLSAKTVDHHVSSILRKLQAGSRTEAAAQATRLGLVER